MTLFPRVWGASRGAVVIYVGDCASLRAYLDRDEIVIVALEAQPVIVCAVL